MRIKINNANNRKGQIMVEAIVALSMLAMGTVGIFTLLSSSYRFNRISTNEYIAANLASEGIEIIRNIVDTNVLTPQGFNVGLIGCANAAGCSVQYDSTGVGNSQGSFLNFNSSSKLYLYGTGSASPFKRKLVIVNSGSPVNRLEVVSTVSWEDRGLDYSVILEDHLYDWRSAVSP